MTTRTAQTASNPWPAPTVARDANETAEPADAALLHAGQAGDKTALAALLSRHERALYALCLGMLNGEAEAEDAVGETFLHALRALERADGFRGDSQVRTWLFTIARNVCRDVLRTRKRRGWFGWGEAAPETPSPAPSPERVVVDRLHLETALSHLTPPQRAALLLREREGWSVGEIADAFQWSEKKTQNTLYQARRALLKQEENNV